MPNFPVHAVEDRFRFLARWVVCCSALAIFMQVTYSVVAAVVGAFDIPPTSSFLINGAIKDKWGRMPYIVVDARGENITGIVFSPYDTFYQDYGDNFRKVDVDAPDFTIHNLGTALVVNLTAYTPDFQHTIHGTENRVHSILQPQCLLCWNVSGNGSGIVDILTAPTRTPQEMFGKHVKGSEQYFVHQAVVEAGMYQWGEIEKAIVPTNTVYWGYPGEEQPVMQQITLTAGAAKLSANPPVSCFHLVVKQSSVSVTAPISVLSQISQAVSAAGGSLALLSSLFLVLFVRKHPLSKEEEKQQQLTFRGLQNAVKLVDQVAAGLPENVAKQLLEQKEKVADRLQPLLKESSFDENKKAPRPSHSCCGKA